MYICMYSEYGTSAELMKDTMRPVILYILCREVVCSSEVQNVLTIRENEHTVFETLKRVLCRDREVISIVS